MKDVELCLAFARYKTYSLSEVKLMPNIESAIKRVHTNEKASIQNTAKLSATRTIIKKFDQAVADGSDNVNELYRDAVKAIDMAASKGLIHKNKAARDKSRLSAKLAK